ncbi:hypothetical protein BDN67DRAFT_916845, partial [Paxillus ammoniavirescens]
MLRRRLFYYASNPWDGETLPLKVALIQAMKNWKALTREGLPRPITFDPKDARKTMKLDAEQRETDEFPEASQDMIGFGPEGWV